MKIRPRPSSPSPSSAAAAAAAPPPPLSSRLWLSHDKMTNAGVDLWAAPLEEREKQRPLIETEDKQLKIAHRDLWLLLLLLLLIQLWCFNQDKDGGSWGSWGGEVRRLDGRGCGKGGGGGRGCVDSGDGRCERLSYPVPISWAAVSTGFFHPISGNWFPESVASSVHFNPLIWLSICDAQRLTDHLSGYYWIIRSRFLLFDRQLIVVFDCGTECCVRC